MKKLFVRLAIASAVIVGPVVGANPASAAPTPGGCAVGGALPASCQFTPLVGTGTLTVIFTGGGEQSATVGSQNGDPSCPAIAAGVRSDRPGVVVMPATYQLGCVYDLFAGPGVVAIAEG